MISVHGKSHQQSSKSNARRLVSGSILLLAGLGTSTAAWAAPCECSQAVLIGTAITGLDTVTAGAAPVNVIVSPQPLAGDANPYELTRVGWGLRPATPALFNIDIDRSSIRIDFLSTEGLIVSGNGGFTFSGLKPKLPAGCRETPAVVDATFTLGSVATGSFTPLPGNQKPDYNPTYGHTISPNQLSVRLARSTGSTVWGPRESLLIALKFGCPKGKR